MSNKKKIYSCDKCSKKFSELRYLQSHLKRTTPCNKKYKCDKCNKNFPSDRELTRHKNRITACVIEEIPVVSITNEENMCNLCGRTFSTSSNLKRHKKTVCNATVSPQRFEQLMNIVEQQQQTIQTLMANGGILPSAVTNNVTNNIQNNLYMNVTFCSFGNEDLSKLDTSKVMNLLRGQVKDFMSKMIEYIHASSDHPEYHNVFYDPVRKKAIVLVSISETELSWQTRDFREVSDILTDRLRDHVAPGNGPYFDLAMRDKDYDTSNNIINIAKHINWKTDESVEMNQNSLSKLSGDPNFVKNVKVEEITNM